MSNIQDVRAIHSPQKSYMWEVSITGTPASPLRELAFFAKTVTIPQSAVEQIMVNHKSSKSHYAGRDAAAHTATITFWDDEAQTIHSYFTDWMSTIRNPVTGGSVARDVYAGNVSIKLKNSEDTETTSEIVLSLAFPIDISDISLSYDSSEPVELSVTMSYDAKTVD